MERIGEIAAFEISKGLEFKEIEISTPLDKIMVKRNCSSTCNYDYFESRSSSFEGILNYFDKADCGFVAFTENTMPMIISPSNKIILLCPSVDGRPLIVADPMLATGASLIEALKDLLNHGTPSIAHCSRYCK